MLNLKCKTFNHNLTNLVSIQNAPATSSFNFYYLGLHFGFARKSLCMKSLRKDGIEKGTVYFLWARPNNLFLVWKKERWLNDFDHFVK